MTPRRGNGDSAQRITSGPSRLRMLLALLAVAAAAAVLAATPPSRPGTRGFLNGNDHRQGEGK